MTVVLLASAFPLATVILRVLTRAEDQLAEAEPPPPVRYAHPVR